MELVVASVGVANVLRRALHRLGLIRGALSPAAQVRCFERNPPHAAVSSSSQVRRRTRLEQTLYGITGQINGSICVVVSLRSL